MEGNQEVSERERDKASGARKPTMSVKDWVTLVLSISAFGISAIGLYVNLLRQKDDVRVVIDDIPEVNYLPEEGRDLPWIVIPGGPLQFTFINAGNRTAAVRSASIVIAQSGSARTPRLKKCSGEGVDDVDGVDWDVHPFVLKPSDVVVVDLKFKDKTFHGMERNRDHDTYLIRMVDTQKLRSRYMFAVCLQFTVVTPDNNSETTELPILAIEFTGGRDWEVDLYNSFRKPLELVSRVGIGLR
jgi:hypothetical protein